MKKMFFMMLLLAAGIAAMAQEQKESVPGPKMLTAIKWNPESLSFGKVSLSGEYNYRKRKSITLGVGIPFEKVHTIKMDDKDRDVSMKTFSIMGGYRMYLGKKTMTGFYFEPYAKYVKNDGSTTIDGDINGTKTDFIFTSKYSGMGIGAQLGVQARIFKVVVLDFFLLGPEANMAKHEAMMQDTKGGLPWSNIDEQDAKKQLEDALKDIPIIGDKINVTVDRNKHTVATKYDGFLPGLRFGASIGVRF